MKSLQRFLALALCVLFVLSVVGCKGPYADGAQPADDPAQAPAEGAAPAEGEAASQGATAYQDTITIGVANDITTLDPQGSNTDANMMAFILTHETLVEVDPETNEVIPVWPRAGRFPRTAAPSSLRSRITSPLPTAAPALPAT